VLVAGAPLSASSKAVRGCAEAEPVWGLPVCVPLATGTGTGTASAFGGSHGRAFGQPE